MSLIEDFLEHYNREFDYYAEVASAVQEQLEAALLSRGIRAMVTSRAKRPDRLRAKLVKRAKDKNYSALLDIYKDIIDLAGVRVALYFPGDRARVGALIEELFRRARKPKDFPESKKNPPNRPFRGYVATHYLVRLKADTLEDAKRRYAETVVEIQVASVLMDAWAEVDHDLVYKPEMGDLSDDETALHEINGLVLVGETALERLQKAVERRAAKDDVNFKDQFELAAYPAQRATKAEMQTADIGKVDVLSNVLRYVRQDTPRKLGRYISGIANDERNRPIADVVLDKVLAGQSKRRGRILSELVTKALSRSPFRGTPDRGDAATEIGSFLMAWTQLENSIRRFTPGSRFMPMRMALKHVSLPREIVAEILRLNQLRNEVVHGLAQPPAATLREAAHQIRETVLPKVHGVKRGVVRTGLQP